MKLRDFKFNSFNVQRIQSNMFNSDSYRYQNRITTTRYSFSESLFYTCSIKVLTKSENHIAHVL